MTENVLSRETSPYLLQHKDNPVHWRPWGEEALAEARRLNRPILLSVGYSACHWCHVMAHESFEDAGTAALMNELFINVKVDREERPDVDTIYQTALALMGEQGGWPLTMFLTPDGKPFWGGTYFPSAPRFGRPAFQQVLHAVSSVFHGQHDDVQKNVSALQDGLERLFRPKPGPALTLQHVDQAAALALRLVDPLRGGTAGAPKFPQPVFFRLLWRAYARTGSALFREAVTVTFERMCQGGIYDHVGGGFARYATDADWLIPHFEKMLYDNALLIDLMTEVWLATRSELLARRIRETIAWVLEDLRVDAGSHFAFAGAVDADSEGAEGKYYIWDRDEIEALLGADAPLFAATYDVRPGGNWEGSTILNLSACAEPPSAADEIRLSRCLDALREARSQRIPPLRDDKILCDWNGLMITALARAAAAFDQASWLAAAETAFRFFLENLEVGGRLRHMWCAGIARHPAVIDDFANLALAAVTLFEITGRLPYLAHAERWVEVANRHYWDPDDGGYFLSADDTRDVISRAKVVADHATPSGNAVMSEVLARLYHLTGAEEYRSRFDALLQLVSSDNPQYLLTLPGLLCGYELLERAIQLVVIGDSTDPRMRSLLRAAFSASQPLKVLTLLSPGDTLREGHPAAGKELAGGGPTAYICVGTTCGLPLTDPNTLISRLSLR
jgi:hypothetical protein